MRNLKRFDVATRTYISYEAPDTWNEIRKRILERDNNQCVKCKSKVLLSVHHKDKSGQLPNYRKPNNNEDNLEALCAVCHGKAHKDFYRKDGRMYTV